MKQSKLLIPTRGMASNEIETVNERLLTQAGYISPLAKGIYAYLPLAERVIQKISQVIRMELSMRDSILMRMPNLLPQEYSLAECAVQEAEDLFAVNDGAGDTYMLAPAHERAFMELIMREVHSYKELPLSLYQTQMKYRDETKKQRGLIDSREFLMTDVYSFHADRESLDQFYRKMEESITRILKTCGLHTRVVNSTSKRLGTKDMREFIAPTPIGKKEFCYASEGEYAATLDVAISEDTAKKSHATYQELTKESFDVTATYDVEKTIKPYFYQLDGQVVLFLMKADHAINEAKIKRFFQRTIAPLSLEAIAQLKLETDSQEFMAFANQFPIYADQGLETLVNADLVSRVFAVRYQQVNVTREFEVTAFFDFQTVKAGDLAPNDQGVLHFDRGISVVQMTKIEPSYAQEVGAVFLDDQQTTQTLNMGYYGIGVTRLFALIVEQYGSGDTMYWPQAIAPFAIHVVPLDHEDPFQVSLANQVTAELEQAGYDLLVDDRTVASAIKQRDADLIGCPIRCTINEKAVEGTLELEIKAKKATLEVRREELITTLAILLQAE